MAADEKARVRDVLERLRGGEIDVDRAAAELRETDELGFASVDYGREARRGFPEVIFGAGKTAAEITAIMQSLKERTKMSVLATRVDAAKAATVRESLPEAEYSDRANLLYIKGKGLDFHRRKLLILTAGTSDFYAAEEARLTARLMGIDVTLYADCGVAGIQRLFAHIDAIRAASVIIVCAGMEGALASVVGGLSRAPIIALPTSVGYGAALGGATALLSMVSSCATGIGVVNIDNGFGAAMLAAHMLLIE